MRKLHKRTYPGNGIFLHSAAGVPFPLVGDQAPLRDGLLHGIGLAKSHWFFVDGQNDAAPFADDTVPSSWSVYGQSARSGRPVLITLRTGEHQNMLITGMFVQRDDALIVIPKEGRSRTGDSIPI
jgi:hypothetical protein